MTLPHIDLKGFWEILLRDTGQFISAALLTEFDAGDWVQLNGILCLATGPVTIAKKAESGDANPRISFCELGSRI